MKSPIWKVCFVVLCLTACNDAPTGPNVWEIPLVNAQFIVEAGSYSALSFSVDLAQMEDPGVVGTVVVNDGTSGAINLLILNAANFILWESGETYTAVFESGQTQGGNLNVDIPDTDDYALVFSNRADTTNQQIVQAISSLVFLQDAQ